MSRRVVVGVLAALLAGLLAMPVPPVGAATFSPVADTHVDEDEPADNYGTKPYLRTDNSPLGVAYLRFNVQGVSGPASAELRLHAETASRVGIEVHKVDSATWSETTTTSSNAPGFGPTIASTGPFSAGTWLTVDVSSAISGNGPVSFALTTPSSTAIKITSREGANKPQLLVPAPPAASAYQVSRNANTYQAVSQPAGTTFTGTAKLVVEAAVADLESSGGGTVQFAAGTFDLGSQFFKFYDAHDVVFAGAGINATIIQNSSSASTDTEPFNFTGADRVVVRDLTVAARGPVRSTSDALDFDQGNDVVVERVKVTASRARGIIFDGKNDNWTALRNRVRDCVITGVPGDGIELLASSDNTIERCTITGVGGHGIQLAKASTSADQPNKKSNDNTVTGNTIDQAGQDGINLTSGDRNKLLNNTITNSSDDLADRDGIRLSSSNSIACDDNVVSGNTATDNQTPKTQRYGLYISSSLCHRTSVSGNNFEGNRSGAIRDLSGTT